MVRRKKKRTKNTATNIPKATSNKNIKDLEAKAPEHQNLADEKVHIFVDDQNLFYGIVNNSRDRGYRIDFGELLRVAATSSETETAREVGSAYIAGIVPDDDSFWDVAKSKGFEVHRGYLNKSGRSKQDDAYLITFIMKTLYEKESPSTIVLVAGDADYVPPLEQCIEKGWRVEIAFARDNSDSISGKLPKYVHEFRMFSPQDIEKQFC